MKISVERPNPYFENCLKLTEEQQEKYRVDDDTDCDECPFMVSCSRGEKIKESIPEQVIYERALNEYGLEEQEGMLIEEIGEVLQAWNKTNRDSEDPREFEDLAEELADLSIMLGQIGEIALGEQFYEKKRKKLRQLHEKLQEDTS